MVSIAWDYPVMGDDPTTSSKWLLCGKEEPSGGPCDEFNGQGGPVWSSTTIVSAGDIYEHPANSGEFYMIQSGVYNSTTDEPGKDLTIWTSSEPCGCKDIWGGGGSLVWDSSMTYSAGMMVSYPAGSNDIWMAVVTQTTSGVAPDQPFADGNQWQLCGGDTSVPASNPCAGLTVVGVWDSSMTVAFGEIYAYPVESGPFYQVSSAGPYTNLGAPTSDLDVWKPIDCPCKETWVANGQPIWDITIDYPGNYVVEWPAGTGNLYIPLEPLGVGNGAEPGVDIHWILCDGPGTNNGDDGPCEGVTSAGVWIDSTQVSIGEIYEYPANSDTYYEVIQVDPNGLISTAPGESQDYEFWEPYSCPCKDIWEANGNPVWDSSIANYSGNYVVEWPAGSGNLFISEAGGLTGAGEPGVDTGHWIKCDDGEDTKDPESELKSDEDRGLPSVGLFATIITTLCAVVIMNRKELAE